MISVLKKRGQGTSVRSPLFIKLLVAFVIMALTTCCLVISDTDDSEATPDASGKCGENITWELENGVLTLTGTGELKDTVELNLYKNKVKSIIIGNGITSIGSRSFDYYTSATSVTISDTVTSIDEYAFSHTAIESITLPNSLTSIGKYAFSGTSIESITLPNGLTTIGDGAFYGCTSLTSITIPGSITTINYATFQECTALTSVTFTNGLTDISNNAFKGCTSLRTASFPNSLKNIKYGAFEGCTSLTTVSIQDGFKTIDQFSFYNCTSLTSITIPDSVTSISPSAFYNCTSLTSINVPDGAYNMDQMLGCTSLTSINVSGGNDDYASVDGVLFDKSMTSLIRYPAGKTGASYEIPAGVTNIRANAFSGCAHLVSVTIPDTVNSIGDCAFSPCCNYDLLYGNTPVSTSLASINVSGGTYYFSIEGVLYNKTMTTMLQYPAAKTDTLYYVVSGTKTINSGAFYGCTSLTDIIIPNTVTSIGSHTFRECTSLTSLTLPNTITSLGDFAFEGCTSLESIDIPDKLTSLGFYAFRGCTSLESIDLPSSVKTLENGTFQGCTSLTSIHIGTYSGLAVDLYAFEGCVSLTTITGGPLGSVGDYGFYGCNSLESVKIWGVNSGEDIGKYAFKGCTSLISIDFGPDINSVGMYSFQDCTSLRSITIPDNVTYWGYQTFQGCTSLTTVILGKNMKSGDPTNFTGCTSLSNFIVSEENEYLSTIDGVLFSKDKTTLIMYPGGKSNELYIVPDGVSSIRGYAFYQCYSLNSIAIPKSVGSIETLGSSFVECDALYSIIVSEDNERYCSIGGVLYNKSRTSLYFCPYMVRTVTVPSEIEYIPKAFKGDIEEIVFTGGSRISVATEAFSDCSKLNKIVVKGGANLDFSVDSISFNDDEEHTIHVEAREGFVIPSLALNGDVKIIYEVLPDSGSSGGLDLPIAYIGIGIAGAVAAVGVAVFFIRRH